MSYIVSAVEQIATHLHPGMLIILESTTYPGTTEELVQPMLEAAGLKAGDDFFLAFSPERVDPGQPDVQHAQHAEGGRRRRRRVAPSWRAALYGAAIETIVPVSSPQVAEMVKLLENTFRAVNIGLVNELALMCDRLGINVWEVIDAAATKPFGFMPFYPGPGLGGHCIPIDPFYLSWKAKQTGFEARFIELAGQVNAAMPHFVVDKIADALNRHRKSVNGSTHPHPRRRLQARHRRHPRVAVARRDDAAAPEGRDGPLRRSATCRRWRRARGRAASTCTTEPLTPATLADADCVAILTDHRAFDYDMVLRSARLIVDTRNAIAGRHPHVFKLGAPRAGDDRSRRAGVPRESGGVRAVMVLALLDLRARSSRTSTSATRCCFVAVGRGCGPRRFGSHRDDAGSAGIRDPRRCRSSSRRATKGARLAARIDNLLQPRLPGRPRQIIVVSDGSTDDTLERARAVSALRRRRRRAGGRQGARAERRRGPRASTTIVVFADARQIFAPDALRELVGAVRAIRRSAR